jgi:hypothetical protein
MPPTFSAPALWAGFCGFPIRVNLRNLRILTFLFLFPTS